VKEVILPRNGKLDVRTIKADTDFVLRDSISLINFKANMLKLRVRAMRAEINPKRKRDRNRCYSKSRKQEVAACLDLLRRDFDVIRSEFQKICNIGEQFINYEEEP